MEGALVRFLKEHVDTVGGRVYLVVAPEVADMPFAVVQRISTVRRYTQSSKRVWAEPRIQITCWGRSYAEANAAADEAKAALQLKAGILADDESIMLAMLIGEGDMVDSEYFGRRMDFRIMYVEE